MKIQTLIFFFLIFNVIAQPNQLFINYGVDREGVQLFCFFHNVTDGYYIDIGAYDSIFASNTLNLQTMGWNGINIDASPSRLPRFFYSRPWQPSLNYAIGDQDQYLTLYQLAQDSSSTVSKKVKQSVKQYKPVVGQIKIPSLSMKQICERFYERRPLFINLDIEGYGSKALLTNDWKNQKCKPDIIFSQINQQLMLSGLPMPQTILQKQGYKKWKNNVGLNQIYILASMYNQYEQTYNIGRNIINNKNIIGIHTVGSFLANILKVSTQLATHHQPINDGIYYHFTKIYENIDIDGLNKYSNLISDMKNRPILIINFNPHVNNIILKTQNYSTSVLKHQQMLKYHIITVYKSDGSNYTAYIYDHAIKPLISPKILLNPSVAKPKANNHSASSASSILNNADIALNQKILKTVQVQIQQLNYRAKNLYNDINIRNKQLQLTLTTNHHYDNQQYNKLNANIENIIKYTHQNTNRYTQQQIQVINNRKLHIVSVLKRLVFVLFSVFFSFLFAFALLCIAHDSYRHSKGSNSGNDGNSGYNMNINDTQIHSSHDMSNTTQTYSRGRQLPIISANRTQQQQQLQEQQQGQQQYQQQQDQQQQQQQQEQQEQQHQNRHEKNKQEQNQP